MSRGRFFLDFNLVYMKLDTNLLCKPPETHTTQMNRMPSLHLIALVFPSDFKKLWRTYAVKDHTETSGRVISLLDAGSGTETRATHWTRPVTLLSPLSHWYSISIRNRNCSWHTKENDRTRGQYRCPSTTRESTRGLTCTTWTETGLGIELHVDDVYTLVIYLTPYCFVYMSIRN